LGDAILVGLIIFICAGRLASPIGGWTILAILLAGALGALIAVAPYVLEYQAAVKMVETGAMVSTISQVQNLEEIAKQIGGATAQWHDVQEQAARTAAGAKELTERMTAEAASFTEFLQKANDGEKANLRLEVEKLRRSEGEWLQIVVRMLDNTYALHQAGMLSGQPNLIEQLGQFQNACRDVARRIGLVPFAPAVDDKFDARIHESPEAPSAPVADARIRATIATGYTFQGQLIRRALVSFQNSAPSGETLELAEPAATPAAKGNTEKAEVEIEEQTLL
jgi:molecular chaperone GrpE (heat shock protein)